MFLTDFVKCAIRNRVSLIGYVGLGFVAANKYFEIIERTRVSQAIGLAVGVALGSTSLGFGTYHAYRRAKDHLEQHGTLDDRFLKKYSKAFYCSHIGIKLAAEEAGLEYKVGHRVV